MKKTTLGTADLIDRIVSWDRHVTIREAASGGFVVEVTGFGRGEMPRILAQKTGGLDTCLRGVLATLRAQWEESP